MSIRVLTTILLASFGLVLAQNPIQPTIEQLQQLRTVLSAFADVTAAQAAGYEQFGGCMSSAQGGQGIHFRNPGLIADPALDFMQPELLMYEASADGSMRLVGAEYLVFQEAWHDAGNAQSPALLGREFSLNTTLLDEPFYALHTWVWHYNPLGIFANWNPLVSCLEPAAHIREH